MKKIFSLLAAVLFAGSMMAQVTITPENSSWTSTAGAQTGTVEGVTVAVTNGVTGSTTAEGATMRIYKDATLTISSASNITKIVFNCVANNTTKYGPGCFGAQEGYSYDAKVGTWEGSATSVSFTASSAQVRATSIVVTLAEGGDTPVDPGDEPVAEWAEITFTKATAAGVFNDTVFTVEGSEFSLKCVDTDGKLKTTANNASFGTVEDRHDYAFRLQTVGKSSSKNNMELNIPADGQLRFAVRTATASDETRTVVLVQGTDTIYNKVAVDKDTVEGASNPRIFNFAYVNVKAGKVAVSYPVNGVNFYSFAFKAGAAEEPVLADTLTCAQAAELAAAGKTDEVIVKGYVTEIAYAWASGSMSFWMADTKDGGKVFEAYKCAIAKAEDAVIVGDLVAAKGNLTYYPKTSTPELAAGCTVEILEAVERPVVEPAQNLGAKTIAEFLELANTKDTCILTGVIADVVNAQYGNFYLVEGTDSLYVYGLKDAAGAYCFEAESLAEGDTLKVLAVYSLYNNAPQAKNAIFVEVKKAAVEPEINYYVAGSMGVWGPDEAYKLTPSNNGEYEGEFTFAANDEFKVIGYDGTTVTWFPEGMNNNYVITEAGDYKITFNPAGNVEGWYEGFFNVVKKEEPVVKDTIQLSWSSDKETVEWKDATASQGWWQMRALSDKAYITLSNAGTVSQTSGTYTVAQLDAAYSYMMIYKGTDTTRVELAEGSITVDDNAGTVQITGLLTGDDGNVYNIAILSVPNPYKYDEKDADFVYDFDSYEINTQYAAQGIVGITTNTDSTYISMTIILPQGQTTLVAGEYQVAATPAYQTVIAGYYDNDKNSPAGSMAATLIEQGGKLYYNEIWYLVSGKATVDANLNITVDALNSNSKLIKANLKAKAQGIEDVKAAKKATKSLKNGILVIEKNGVQYNVTGQEIR